MRWNSINQMVEELKLESDPSDTQNITKELKQRIVPIHPDNFKGEFNSEADKEKYLLYRDALEYCNSQEKKLIPLDTVTDLVKTIAQNLSISKKVPIEEQITVASKNWKVQVGKKYFIPKISLGTITALLAFVFWFPQTTQAHPYISSFLASEDAFILWFFTVVFLICLWVLVWKMEEVSKKIISKMFSIETQHLVLTYLYKQYKKKDNEDDILFTRKNIKKSLLIQTGIYHYISKQTPYSIQEFILEFFLPFNIYYYSIHFIDRDSIEQATDLCTERFLEKGWIQRVSQITLNVFIESGEDNYYRFVE